MKATKIEVLEADLSCRDGMTYWCHAMAGVHSAEGVSGLGEVGMAYGTGAPAAAPMILTLGERFILGADPFHTETVWEHMLRRTFWAEGGGGPVIFGAMSAIDTALWDIKGKVYGQ